MPFYEYVCDRCGAEFEALLKSMNAKAPNCTQCGSKKVTKKLSVFGVGAGRPDPSPPSGCGGCAQSGSCPMSQ